MNKEVGTYVQMTSEHIDDGKLKTELDDAISAAMAALDKYERKTGETNGKASITLKLDISRASGTNQYYAITYQTKQSTTPVKYAAMAKGSNGMLLANPDGDSLNDDDQMVMTFDRHGRPIAAVDKITGEIIEQEKTIAGKIAN